MAIKSSSSSASWDQVGNREDAIPGDGGGGRVTDGRDPVAHAVVGRVERAGGGQTEPVYTRYDQGIMRKQQGLPSGADNCGEEAPGP